jgi:hypothetical protein
VEALELLVFEAPLPSGIPVSSLLVAVDRVTEKSGRSSGPVRAAVLNPVLVGNCPVVADGRSIEVTSTAPERISLLWQQLVTRDVVERLSQQQPSRALATMLEKLPLAAAVLEKTGRIVEDFQGLGADPTSGELVLNSGTVHSPSQAPLELAKGERLRLEWYRRTSGSRGNVGVGRISLVEQSPFAPVRVRAAYNPLPLQLGADAEGVDRGIGRLFSPPARTLPATAFDFEAWAREVLAGLGDPWTVRCWGAVERTLLASDWWIPEETARGLVLDSRARLERAGPRALLLVLGQPGQAPGGSAYLQAGILLQRAWARLQGRLPGIEVLVTSPLIPLTLHVPAGQEAPALSLPRFELKGLSGVLAADGAPRPVPSGVWFFLNAAVTEVRSARQPGGAP